MALDPDALASCGYFDLDDRPGVVIVDNTDIVAYVRSTDELPIVSAQPFADWLDGEWDNFNEDGDRTNGQVISGALAYWRGQA